VPKKGTKHVKDGITMAIIGTPWTGLPHDHLAIGDEDFELTGIIEADHVPLRAAAHAAALREQATVQSHLARLLEQEIAWNAAMLELDRATTLSALRAGQARASVFETRRGESEGTLPAPLENRDARLLTGTQVPALRIAEASAGKHAQAMQSAIKAYIDLSARSTEAEFRLLFHDETKCREYLQAWQQQRSWECPICLATERYFYRVRDVFGCPSGHQFPIRYETIYARSKVPLTAWFNAVAYVAMTSGLASAPLARSLGMNRQKTVRQMIAKVRQALTGANAERELAGVHHLVAAYVRDAPSAAGQPSLLALNPLIATTTKTNST
jgi:hypothetical protein